MEEILKLVQENLIASLAVAFVLGGGAVWPLIRRAAAATPTKVDDAICAMIDKILDARKQQINEMTVEQLDKLITPEQLAALVALHNARVKAKKAAQDPL